MNTHPPTSETIGFIGLGVMGAPMAQHLLNTRADLRVFTRTPEKARPLLRAGAAWADSPADLAEQCDILFTIVGYPRDVQEVYFGPQGLLSTLRPDTLLVDMTTSSPDLAERIATAARERNADAMDAPVSGGDKGAQAATLSIMVGASETAYTRALPWLNVLGDPIVRQGPPGAGQHCKLCNQIVVAANMVGVCESLAYAQAAGLDPHIVLQSITGGAAGSWLLSNLAPRILDDDFAPGFYVKHFIKDMTLALQSAKDLHLHLPGLQQTLERYQRLADLGHQDEGTQALFKLVNPPMPEEE